jgi:hypothetical protein
MFQPNPKIFIILLIILGILILLVLIFPYKKSSTYIIQHLTIPTPTKSEISPPNPSPTLIPATSTGGNEEVAPQVLSFATQKQALKKKTPLTQTGFKIEYSYDTDLFTVTLNEPKVTNRNVFNQWLKKNYSAIPLNKFVIQ